MAQNLAEPVTAQGEVHAASVQIGIAGYLDDSPACGPPERRWVIVNVLWGPRPQRS
jgi:hypothetical protein